MIFTGVGIISLAGVVVNNAIVLIDYINLLIRRKREEKGLKEEERLSPSEIKACIIEGGATRLRPFRLPGGSRQSGPPKRRRAPADHLPEELRPAVHPLQYG